MGKRLLRRHGFLGGVIVGAVTFAVVVACSPYGDEASPNNAAREAGADDDAQSSLDTSTTTAPSDSALADTATVADDPCDASKCPTTFVMNEPGVVSVAIRGDNLVWTREKDGLVRAAPLAGGVPPTTILNLPGATGVATDGDQLFITQRSLGQISRYSFTGSKAWTVTGRITPSGISWDGATVWWTSQNTDALEATDFNASLPPTQRATGLNYPADVAVVKGNAYVATGSGIMTFATADAGPKKLLTSAFNFQDAGGDLVHTGVTVHSGTVFFTVGSLGIVASVPMMGGTVTVLARGQNSPHGIAADATTIYWANRGAGAGAGRIMKLPR